MIIDINAEPTLKPDNTTSIVTEDNLIGLPASVQRYLRHSGVIGKPQVETVRLKYTGAFRMKLDNPWMPLYVTQFYTVNPPAFLWKARFKMMGMPFMFATDTFKNGHSHIFGKVFGLFTVLDGRGEEIDQGTMVRYLQEISWFPAAYLADYIHWQAVDDHAADVTLTVGDRSVTGRMYFDDAGRMLTFAAQRYGEFDGNQVMKTWTTPITEYAEINGMNLPVAGLGVWQLPSADFSYVNVQVVDLTYNVPVPKF